MIGQDSQGEKPWYRQFWPWFLIALPASVVVAGITTVFIAFKHADALVDDDYFKEGMAINKRLERELLAEALGLRAEINWDNQRGEVQINLGRVDAGQLISGYDAGQQLLLKLQHPTDQQRDRQLVLSMAGAGSYHASYAEALQHRYYLKLAPLPGEAWRLKGEINFSADSQVVLGMP